MKTRDAAPGHTTPGGRSTTGAAPAEHPVLALQQSIGNRATSAVIARLKKPAPARPLGLNVGEFVAAHAPGLLGVIPPPQIKALQERYDAEGENKEVQKRAQAFIDEYEAQYHLPITGDGNAMRKLEQIKAKYRQVPKAPAEFTVNTAELLGPDFAKYGGRNPFELKFRRKAYDELVRQPTRVILDEHDDRVILRCGDTQFWHDKGRVTFERLLLSTDWAQRHLDEVDHAPEIVQLENALHECAAAIGELSVDHAGRIEQNEKHPIVRRIAEWLGGPDMKDIAEVIVDAQKHPEKGTVEQRVAELNASCPDIEIWKAPNAAVANARKALVSGEYDAAVIGTMAASNLTEKAARQYVAYETRVMKGAGTAVTWLERAKLAGKIAASIASAPLGPGGQALVAGGYSLAQEGAQQVSGGSVDLGGLLKGAAVEGATAWFGGLMQGAFGNALKLRFADKVAKYPVLAERAIGAGSAVTSSFYTAPFNHAVTKIVNGQLPVPTSAEELADLVAEEATSTLLMEATVGTAMHVAHGHAGDTQATPRREGAPELPKLPGAPEPHAPAGATPPVAEPHAPSGGRPAGDPTIRPDAHVTGGEPTVPGGHAPAGPAGTVGGVRGPDVYHVDPNTKLELGSKDWLREVNAISKSRLHGAKVGENVVPKKPGTALLELEVPTADRKGTIKVEVEVELKAGTHLPEGPHKGTGGAGPARVELVEVRPGEYEAKVHVDQNLMAEDVRFVLGHELDEIADTVRRGARHSDEHEAGIFVEAAHAKPPAGGPTKTPKVTAHDRATAREYLNVRADVIETEGRVKTAYEAARKAKDPVELSKRLAEHRDLMAELQRRKTSEWKLRKLMGLDEPGNVVAKREVLREALEGHPAKGKLETMLEPEAEHQGIMAGKAELDKYEAARPKGAPPTEFDIKGVGHLMTPEPQGSIGQFRTDGIGGGHQTESLLAFVDNNPNHWVVELKTREHGGVKYRRYEQYMWDPAQGPPPPRPAGLKPGGRLPPGKGWVKSGQPKTTADDFHGFLGQVEAALGSHRRANRPIPSMQQVTISAGGARFIVIVAAGPPARVVSAFPEARWI